LYIFFPKISSLIITVIVDDILEDVIIEESFSPLDDDIEDVEEMIWGSNSDGRLYPDFPWEKTDNKETDINMYKEYAMGKKERPQKERERADFYTIIIYRLI